MIYSDGIWCYFGPTNVTEVKTDTDKSEETGGRTMGEEGE